MSDLTLLACQIAVPETRDRAGRDRHVGDLIEKIDRRLGQRQADLVVLPELASVEYSRAAFDRLAEISEPLDGPRVKAIGELAAKHAVHIVFGMPRRDGADYFITMVALGPTGDVIGHYDKLHICQYGASMEKEYFRRGDHLMVFEVKGFRVAPIICYDIRIPELTRVLCCDHGAHLILHCGVYARDESFFSWRHFAVTRAMENQVFFASISRAGEAFGESIVCPPWVDEHHPPTVFGTDEEFRFCRFEMSELKAVRAAYTFLSDRLDDYCNLPMGRPPAN